MQAQDKKAMVMEQYTKEEKKLALYDVYQFLLSLDDDQEQDHLLDTSKK